MASFKELCLLHARDSEPQSFRPLVELLNDPAHIVSWSTLQRILHMDNLGDRALKTLHDSGRLDDEKLVAGLEANAFLREHRKKQTTLTLHGIYQNIYEIVWLYGFGQDYMVQSKSFYRGQWDSQWRQVSTLLRDGMDGVPLDVGLLVNRINSTKEFVTALRERQGELFSAQPTDEELLAVAQHYGFPTPMLDYTSSLRVAAWFATKNATGLSERRTVIGVIHRISHVAETKGNHSVGSDPRIGKFSLTSGATIRFGNVQFIRPRLSDLDNRIARQEGLFVSGFQPRDLRGAALGSFYFWQEPGEVYEDPLNNITASYLLPDQSAIASLADEIHQRTGRTSHNTLIAGLGSTMLPQPALFGASGFQLQAVLTDGRLFFNTLNAHIARLDDANYVRNTLGQVFDEYFGLCRIRADLGEIPHQSQEAVNPLALAISRLAMLSGINEEVFLSTVQNQLPVSERVARGSRREKNAMIASNAIQRIALATAVFLKSWEILQHVDGENARGIALDATTILGPVDDYLGYDLKFGEVP